MNAGGQVRIARLGKRELVRQERPLGIDHDEVVGETGSVLHLRHASVILRGRVTAPRRSATMPPYACRSVSASACVARTHSAPIRTTWNRARIFSADLHDVVDGAAVVRQNQIAGPRLSCR